MEEDQINYNYLFNKIFTGSYLEHNLGHELINFIKLQNNERYIYINPWGERSKKAVESTDYVFHIMGVTYDTDKYYELIAVSKVKKGFNGLYNKDVEKEKTNIENSNLYFEGCHLSNIFTDSKAHVYSFLAEKFYIPKKGVRILFKVNAKNDVIPSEPETIFKDEITNNIIYKIDVRCNPQRNRCYAKNADEAVLKNLVEQGKYLEENDDNIVLDKDEQCFAVISDRTNLEDSTSNQIAYFLGRDKEILNKLIDLINRHLTDDVISKDEKFEIKREANHIDLLLVSNKHVIVIENKIDSKINGEIESDNKNKESQLSAYYKYVMKDNKFKEIDKSNKHFFILLPRYSSITRKKLDEYLNGKDYEILYYDELYNELKNHHYDPYHGKDVEGEAKRDFLYEQFIDGLKYISSSKAEQMKETAYIRLKQKINELKNE